MSGDYIQAGGFLRLAGSAELLQTRTVHGKVTVVIIDLAEHSLTLDRGLPDGGKLIRGPRSPMLVARPDNASFGIGHGGQEISRRRTRRALESQLDEIVLRFVWIAEEDLTALIEDGYLVEQLTANLANCHGHNSKS